MNAMAGHRLAVMLQNLLVTRVAWFALSAIAVVPLALTVARRDALAASPRTRATPRSPPPKKGDTAPDAGPMAAPVITAEPLRSAAAPVPAPSLPSDAGVIEAKTLDGGTRAFKFSELDIEGRLKSPQLVYFLRRVRAEFAAEDLGHRSFIREMSETRKEPSF